MVRTRFFRVAVTGSLLVLVGCAQPSANQELSSPRSALAQERQQPGASEPIPVDAVIAKLGSLPVSLAYVGTTQPVQEVALRAQAEGQLLQLSVDVGDLVNQGQVVGQLEDSLLNARLNQARAELAALGSEVARAQAQVSNARAQMQQSRLQMQQAIADADRFEALQQEGAISAQAAEQARTTAQAAEQAFEAAEEQVQTEMRAVDVAEERVVAQEAVVAEAERQQDFAILEAPISGSVLQKVAESGSLVRAGEEVIRIGDFRRVKVLVQISELDRSQVAVGQRVQVNLDAYPGQVWQGEITRISPAADPVARLVPVEITLPNPEQQLGSGLLARVEFRPPVPDAIVVPQSALTISPEGEASLFVVGEEEGQTRARRRVVKVGEQVDGQVEIITGLTAGESFVVRSGRSLQDGDAVSLSVLSEPRPEG
ncbi:MAG: efflux RND transporter periplasmic adaptor subunit [Synechococcaceae cyanobacterium SM2_3_1]|nr:efflux RND transporter periplasmic adaptor subunit [Synechococcaceae cyanobacterium SM2_3_1]